MEKQNNILQLWDSYKASQESVKSYIEANSAQVLKEWAIYSSKIKSGTLSLDEYTSRRFTSDAQKDPNEYLCHFLETKSSNPFGSAKLGSARQFMLKLNDDNSTYYIKDLNDKQEIKAASEEDAQQHYTEVLQPFLKEFLCKKTIDEKFSFLDENDKKYEASQMLYKMIALEHEGEFLYMYSEEFINRLYEYFLPQEGSSKQISRIRKNYQVTQLVKGRLKLEEGNGTDMIIMSNFLWGFANAKSLADANSPNVILHGPPGTGKTYQVKQMLDMVCGGDMSRYEMVQFHPSFTYEDFIEGIKPKGVGKDGNIEFGLVNGVFKKFCIKANNNPEKDYYFVVDEINRANLSAVFGETLSLLEKDYRDDLSRTGKSNLIKTQYSSMVQEKDAYEFIDGEAYFGIPENVYFIGMMNDVDKSIDTFDLALRRRFKWIRKDCDYDVIKNNTYFKKDELFDNIDAYARCAENLNDHISETLGLGKSYEFGHSFFMRMSDIAKRKLITEKNLADLFNLYMRPTLKEYLRAFYSEIEIEGKNKTGNDGMLHKALETFQKGLKR